MNNSKKFLLLVAVVAWFGIIVNLYYNLIDPAGFGVSFSNTISYFTIQSNLLVALFATFMFFKKGTYSKLQKVLYFGSVLNITITAIVYILVLNKTGTLQGISLVIDLLHHYIVPVLYIIYWVFVKTRERWEFKFAFLWLIYPLAYLIYTLVRGAITGWYPYFFLNAQNVSALTLLLITLGFGVFFIVMGFGVVFLNNKLVFKPE